jgi:hypothetical protein
MGDNRVDPCLRFTRERGLGKSERVSKTGWHGLRVSGKPGQGPREPESRLDSGPGLSVGVTFPRGNDTTSLARATAFWFGGIHALRQERRPGWLGNHPLLDFPPRFVGIVLGDLAGNLGGFLS